jgi:hypothetical protein
MKVQPNICQEEQGKTMKHLRIVSALAQIWNGHLEQMSWHYQCTNLLSQHADHGLVDSNAMQFCSYVPTYQGNLLPAPGIVVHPPHNSTLHPFCVHQLTYWTLSCLWRKHPVEILALFFRALQYTHLTYKVCPESNATDFLGPSRRVAESTGLTVRGGVSGKWSDPAQLPLSL